MKMKKLILGIFLFGFFLNIIRQAPLNAQSPRAAKENSEAKRLKTLKVSLDQFSKYKTIEMKTISTSYPVNFPIPERWSIKSIRLILHYTNAVTLIHERSQLAVALNNRPIGQVRPNPSQPDGVMNLSIPVSFLAPGYNSLNFSVAQHYQDTCEQWDSPNLWTTLDLTGSFLELTYSEKPVPLGLSKAAGFMFDSKVFPHGQINIVTDIGSSDMLTAAGILASAVAHRFEYKKVVFTASNDIKPGQDNILIGKKDYVEALAKKLDIDINVSGPLIKIMHLPAGKDNHGRAIFDQTRGLMIVAGTSPQETLRAAMAVSGLTIPFPGSDQSIVKEFAPPDLQAYSANKIIEAGREYPLKQLDFRTYTFRKVNPLATEIAFRLPNDYKIAPNKYATLKLNYSYGPGMKDASSLTVSVNETVARTIQLDKAKGDFITGYHLDLPTYLFKPGLNTITFTSYLNPKGDNCEMFMPDSYFMTLHDNSTLRFPVMAHFVQMPDIGFFMDDGFPFTRWRDGRECEIYITQPDYDLLSAVLNIMGFIAQRCDYPLFGSHVSVGRPSAGPSTQGNTGKEIIVVGSLDSVPDDLLLAAPIRIGKGAISLYPVAETWSKKALFATARQISGIDPDSGMLMEFESPFKNGRTVLLFTAASPGQLVELSRLLLSPSISSRMRGTAVFVDLAADSQNSVTVLDTGKSFWTGKFGRISALTYFLYVYPYTNYLLAIFLVLAAGLAMYYVLARIRRRRLALAKSKHTSN